MIGKASETDLVSIMAMVKDGGYERLQIPSDWVGKLALAIKNSGYETARLASGKTFDVVGFVVTGSMTGERIIVSGKEAKEDESNS